MKRIKSAVKRAEVAERNRQRNVAYKSAIKTAMKKALAAEGEPAEKLSQAFSLIDRAILKGILAKNTGARYKSRLAKAVQKSA